jgi:hypothetical protein
VLRADNAVIEGKRVLVSGRQDQSRDVRRGSELGLERSAGGVKEGDRVVTSLEKQGVKAGGRAGAAERAHAGGGATRASR